MAAALAVHYDSSLVLVSVLVAIGASHAALSLADRVQAAATRNLRQLWITSGAIALGAGTWSMHYLGMLAIGLPVPVYYHVPTVLLSLALAILAARVALFVVSADTLGKRRLLIGGLLMGAGIGSMHYVGMAAMRSSAMEQYNPWIVVLSVVIAATFSWLALRIAYASRNSRRHIPGVRLAASVVMGLAISAMHYVAMAGVRFTLCTMPFSLNHAVAVHQLGASVVIAMVVLILLAAQGTSALDKRRTSDLLLANADLMALQDELIELHHQLGEANTQLGELSVRDGLTGLHNRRHLDSTLATEFARAARYLKPISLLILDVDSFKSLNDTYGHQRGDHCLRELAAVLEATPRRGYDTVARYGGDEFVLLLPDADYEAAIAIAESIRRGALDLNIENLKSPVSRIVTVTIGVCCRNPRPGDDHGAFLREADRALYRAKQMGRNCIAIAEPVASEIALVGVKRA